MQGRTRQFLADGTLAGAGLASGPALQLAGPGKLEAPDGADPARLRPPRGRRPAPVRARFPAGAVEVEETLRILRDDRAAVWCASFD